MSIEGGRLNPEKGPERRMGSSRVTRAQFLSFAFDVLVLVLTKPTQMTEPPEQIRKARVDKLMADANEVIYKKVQADVRAARICGCGSCVRIGRSSANWYSGKQLKNF